MSDGNLERARVGCAEGLLPSTCALEDRHSPVATTLYASTIGIFARGAKLNRLFKDYGDVFDT